MSNIEYSIRLMNKDEVSDVYNEHVVTDFPASEVKPLKMMLEKMENDQYFVYGMYERKEKSAKCTDAVNKSIPVDVDKSNVADNDKNAESDNKNVVPDNDKNTEPDNKNAVSDIDDNTSSEELAGYAYFIKCRNQDVYLLDYLAIVKDKRSKHLGSRFLQALKKMAAEDGKLLILEVENPEYADEGPDKDYMIKRIGFYEKNGMCLSNTSCYFLDNEYRIFYAKDSLPVISKQVISESVVKESVISGTVDSDSVDEVTPDTISLSDEEVDRITDTVYRDFFSDAFVDANVVFHTER